jgi:hypothetical protein
MESGDRRIAMADPGGVRRGLAVGSQRRVARRARFKASTLVPYPTLLQHSAIAPSASKVIVAGSGTTVALKDDPGSEKERNRGRLAAID